jgi:hypothetical protein
VAIEASDDGTDWTALGEFAPAPVAPEARFWFEDYALAGADAHRYYRLVARELGTATGFGVAELQFLEE